MAQFLTLGHSTVRVKERLQQGAYPGKLSKMGDKDMRPKELIWPQVPATRAHLGTFLESVVMNDLRIGPQQRRAIEDEVALMERCPHWESCNAVECPLDPLQGQRGPVAEEQCHARIATRKRIIEQARAEGIATALKHEGFLYREWVRQKRSAGAKARWQALPEEEKCHRRERLRQARQKAALSLG